MARPADPRQAAALFELLKHLRVGADVELVRPHFGTVPKTTWCRWVKLAREQFAAEGGAAPQPPQPKPSPASNSKAKTGANKKAAPAVTGELMPAKRDGRQQRSSRPAPPPDGDDGGSQSGLSADGATYTVMTMFGPKESSVIDRFVDQPSIDPHSALAILERMCEQYLNAEALMRASIKRVGDGHAILDASAYAAAVELQRKTLMDQLKILERSRNLDSVQRFIGVLMQRIEREKPEIALDVVAALRSTVQELQTAWSSQIA